MVAKLVIFPDGPEGEKIETEIRKLAANELGVVEAKVKAEMVVNAQEVEALEVAIE